MGTASRGFVPLYAFMAAVYVFERIFMLDPALVSSAWLPLTAAFIVILPVLFCTARLICAGSFSDAFENALGHIPARIWYAAVCLILSLEIRTVIAVFSASVMAYTAEFVHRPAIIFILLIMAGTGACMGHKAVARGAKLTLILMLFILGILAAGALHAAHLEHFFPIMGPGGAKLRQSILPLAGCALMPLIFLFDCGTLEPCFRRAIFKGAAYGILIAALSLCIYTLAQPTLPAAPVTVAFRTSALLSNGSNIHLQLPLILLWNASQIMLISGLMSISGRLIQLALPPVKQHGGLSAILLEALLLAILPTEEGRLSRLADMLLFPVTAAGLSLAGALHMLRSRH